MRVSRLFVLLFALSSCMGDHIEDAAPADKSTEVYRYFPYFPDQHFDVIKLGETTAEVESKLRNNGYKAKLNQPGQFKNEAKQIEVILPEAPTIQSFRVFLYRENDIADYDDFVDYFSKSSATKSISNEFSVFDFETLEQDFTISIFKQPDFLRLNYELNTSH
jgi:hypothetical protein